MHSGHIFREFISAVEVERNFEDKVHFQFMVILHEAPHKGTKDHVLYNFVKGIHEHHDYAFVLFLF